MSETFLYINLSQVIIWLNFGSSEGQKCGRFLWCTARWQLLKGDVLLETVSVNSCWCQNHHHIFPLQFQPE